MRKMFPALVVILLVVAPICRAADDLPPIDHYDFTWTLYHQDKTYLQVEKTEDATTIYLREDFDSARMTPAEAEAVGAAVAKADAYATKLKGTDDGRETIDCGNFGVTFWNSLKYGFSISIGEKNSFGGSPSLSKADAKAIAPLLLKATKLAATVDAKIKP